jgi:selenocysteine lyase/cysteine desulfurase
LFLRDAFTTHHHGAVTTLTDLQALFPRVPGYLDAATCGIPSIAAARVMRSALDDWSAGTPDLPSYDAAVIDARQAFARIVDVPTDWVAIGSQTSVSVGMIAASLPPGSEVLVVEDDFTSIIYPFLMQPGLTVRAVPLESLAHEVRPSTTLVSFSLAQSSDGRVADVDAILAATRRTGTRTLVDLTQAGWLPAHAQRFDVTVTSAYKWLAAPRGTAFITLSPRMRDELRPVNAGWYAGEVVWESVYGTTPRLAPGARRFDVGPDWLVWVGAVPTLQAFADADLAQVRDHDVALADRLRSELGMAPAGSAIVSLPDPDGSRRSDLAAHGIRSAGRAGRLRLAFHLWNDEEDLARALAVLTR